MCRNISLSSSSGMILFDSRSSSRTTFRSSMCVSEPELSTSYLLNTLRHASCSVRKSVPADLTLDGRVSFLCRFIATRARRTGSGDGPRVVHDARRRVLEGAAHSLVQAAVPEWGLQSRARRQL